MDHVPLSTTALALIKSLPHHRRCSHVFTVDGRNAVRNMHTPKARIDAGMAKVLGRKPEPFVIHDLRRVVRSWAAKQGIAEPVAERMLGHGPKNKLQRTYDTYSYMDELRVAFQRWADHVEGLAVEGAGPRSQT